MSEQPLNSSDIVADGAFEKINREATEFLNINRELQSVLKENLLITQKILSSSKIFNSDSLKNNINLNREAIKNLQQLEILKKQEAQTEAALANVRAANDRALKAQLSSEAAFDKALKNEKKSVTELKNAQNELVSVYDIVRKKYNDLSKAQIELSIRGRENGKVFRAIKDEATLLRAELDKAEQGAGRFQRNVGNYKSGFDGLGNSVNQLTREFPAFANSVQTGLLAISNNLPMFFDQIAKIKKENAELAEEGKKGESIFKQLGGAIFSFGSILSIGVTLLTLYGKEIVDWVSSLFEGEKALKSLTEANKEFNKSISQTKEDIANLTIDLKVQTGILSKHQGELLKNENARTKALNSNKELRKKSIYELKKELEISDDILKKVGKTRQIITQGGEVREISLLSSDELKRVNRYNKGLKEINDEFKLANDYTNTKYNLQGKIDQQDKGRLAREKATTEELIIQKHAYDEIRQQEINLIDDQIEREKQQLLFNSDKAIRDIELANEIAAKKTKIENNNYNEQVILIKKNITDEKQRQIDLEKLYTDHQQKLKKIASENIPEKEQAQLRILIAENTNKELAEIEKKAQEKQNEENKKAFEKTIESREKIRKDNANADINQLQREYNEKEKKLDLFNLKETNQLEKQISAKKVAEIQAEADRKKALTENIAEREAIQNEANIAIQEETERLSATLAKNEQTVLNQAISQSQKILDVIAKEEAKKAELRQQGYDKQISDAEKNIETQRRLAEKGAQNTLAEAEASKVQLERQKELEKQQEVKRQKAIAFFKLFSSYAEKDPNTALQKALKDTLIAEAIAGAFFEGTERVSDDLQGNKVHNGRDGYRIAVDGSERILTGEQNNKVGNISNDELANLAHDYRLGILDTAKYAIMPSADFSKNVENSALLHQTIQLNKRIESLEKTLKDKPVHNFSFDNYGNIIEETIANGMKKITTHKLKRQRV